MWWVGFVATTIFESIWVPFPIVCTYASSTNDRWVYLRLNTGLVLGTPARKMYHIFVGRIWLLRPSVGFVAVEHQVVIHDSKMNPPIDGVPQDRPVHVLYRIGHPRSSA